MKENIFFFLIFLARNSFLTKTTDSCSFLLKKYLVIVNLSQITLSSNHSIMYVIYVLLAKKLVSQKEAIAVEENFIAFPHQVT